MKTKEFINNFSNIKFYELIDDELNIKQNAGYKEGELYFTDLDNLIMLNKKYIREIKLLDDSLIYKENNIFKTNKFIIGEIKKIPDYEIELSKINLDKLTISGNTYILD